MIESDFDRWTLANMNAALDLVCEKIPQGEEHAVRKRAAKQIVKCARSGKTDLSDLTAAGQRALIGVAASRPVRRPEKQPMPREDMARSA
jgi:transcriptional regulator GlxA family with amidase domain